MRYPVAEKFKSIQGEGLYTGVPMAFIRLVGCSVGKKVCTHCDTDFEKTYPQLGGGLFQVEDLVNWASGTRHVCITGGEPLDRPLEELFVNLCEERVGALTARTNDEWFHIETSGTRPIPKWLVDRMDTWFTVSPKPGYLRDAIDCADEIKVILHGLGEGSGWPTLEDALEWAKQGKLVYVQPRNDKHTIDGHNMEEVQELVNRYPSLRLSTQFHKFIHVR